MNEHAATHTPTRQAARAAMVTLLQSARSYAARNEVEAVAHELAGRGGNDPQLSEELQTRIVDSANAAVLAHPSLTDELIRYAAAGEPGDEPSDANAPTSRYFLRARRRESVARFIAIALTNECLLHTRHASNNPRPQQEVKQ